MHRTLAELDQRGKERKSVTDTDLITAGGSSDDIALPEPVNSPVTEQDSPAPSDESAAPPQAEPAQAADVASNDRSGSLTSMVLPDLRALAGELGVKGASAMRKSELIAAIREQRGEANGRATGSAPAEAAAAAEDTEPNQAQNA